MTTWDEELTNHDMEQRGKIKKLREQLDDIKRINEMNEQQKLIKYKEAVKLLHRSLCFYMDHAPQRLEEAAYDPHKAVNLAFNLLYEDGETDHGRIL